MRTLENSRANALGSAIYGDFGDKQADDKGAITVLLTLTLVVRFKTGMVR